MKGFAAELIVKQSAKRGLPDCPFAWIVEFGLEGVQGAEVVALTARTDGVEGDLVAVLWNGRMNVQEMSIS